MSPRSARAPRGEMSATPLLIRLFLLNLVTVFVWIPTNADSSENPVVLPPTIVKALRIETPRAGVSSPVESLREEDIQARDARTVADLLDGLTGIHVQRYGTLGSLQTVTLHGASSSHVVVVSDGMRLNSLQGSFTDLSLWDADELRRVEVARGGYSALYGADAAGGVVLLESLRTREMSPFSVTSQAGSFGLRGGKVGVTLPLGAKGVHVALSRHVAENDFPYEWYGEPRHRWNSDTQQTQARLRWELPIRWGDWTLSGQETRRSLGVPGVETGAPVGENTPRSRQWDENRFLSLQGVFPSELWDATVFLGARGAFQRYRDPSLRVDSRHNPRAFNASLQGTRLFGETRLLSGLDADFSTITSTDVKNVEREHAGLFLMAIRPFDLPQNPVFETAQADIAARRDAFSDFGQALSPRGGIVLRRGNFRLFGSLGRNFRAPTFNDLYWQPGGNPDLRPERSVNRAVGVGWNGTSVSAEGSYVNTRLTDQIRWFPTTGGNWSPQNLSRSRLEGFDGSVAVRNGRWQATLRGAHTDALQQDGTAKTNLNYGKQIILIPRDTASAEIRFGNVRQGTFLQYRWAGRSFTRADNRDSLPGYSVLDANVWRSVRFAGMDYEARLSAENLLGRRYVVIPQYPLPGRAFTFTVSAHLPVNGRQ